MMPVTRDAMIVTDVEKMAELKRFDEEITIYGSSFWSEKEKTPYYLATRDLDKIEKYVDEQQYQGSYFTPIVSLTERLTIPSGAYEFVIRDMQYKLLKMMKAQYEPEYYSIMPMYYSVLPNDNAEPYLKKFFNSIYGRFEKDEVILFQKTVQYAYRAKILQQKSYEKFVSNYNDIMHQMENDPTMKKTVNRTFFGFCYLENSKKNSIVNAQRRVVAEEYEKCVNKGIIVAPIMSKKYALENYNQIRSARDHFSEWLDHLEGNAYFNFLYELKNLPGVIDKEMLDEVVKKCRPKKGALEATMHFKVLWNGM